MKISLLKLLTFAAVAVTACSAAGFTGNWVVRDLRSDGTQNYTYLDLHQEGSHITGTIRTTQYLLAISDSSVTGDSANLTANLKNEPNRPPTKFEIKQVGDTLHVAYHRRPNMPLIEAVAQHAPAGEGALPPKLPLPSLHKVPANGLALTPPMGWNSWNKFAGKVDDAGVRAAADAIASNGMKEAGYLYVNVDDTWQGERDAQGNIQPNKKFPDMKALADYVHAKGLKIGIYSSPGPNTCAGYEGSYGHEKQDADTYAAWGYDYLKYDWCGARNIYTQEELQPVYQKMGDALQASGRPIVYSLCQYGWKDVWKWGPEVGGNLWRTTGDISDSWASMTKIGFSQSDLAPYAAPGHWNDPDMLEVGNGGMTNDEYRTHMSLWSILTAPLLAGNDLQQASPEILAILTNRDVIAIDQDTAGKQGKRVSQNGDSEIWAKDLADGSKAVALFNRAAAPASVAVKWSDLALTAPPAHAKDLWAGKDVALSGASYSATVPAHGVVLLRVAP